MLNVYWKIKTQKLIIFCSSVHKESHSTQLTILLHIRDKRAV